MARAGTARGAKGARRRGAGRKWIKGAIKRPGALTRKAKAAGLTVQAFARKMRKAPGRLGKQARLALTLKKISRRR
ncbi:unnamed protein product [marine sediment metagenome]|uniref:Uncharacterized protein n=1 Tax=marine sediment metagenome TaxID=412755 RepID=X0YXI8_9ZZZZ